MSNNDYLKTLLADKDSILEVLFELQNNGKSMNYWESCKGNLELIIHRAKTIVSEMKEILPKGNFEIQIEDIFEGNTFVYVNQDTFYLNSHIQATIAL